MRDSSSDRSLTVAGWCATAIVAIVPLFILPAAFGPFRAVKLLGSATFLVVGLVACGVTGRLSWPRWRWFAAWLAALTLSSVAGAAPWIGVFGSPNRSAGLIGVLLGVGAFVLGASTGGRADLVRLTLRGAMLGGAAVGIIGVCERLGLDVIGLGGASSSGRARSTWGSATFAGAHLVMVAPIAAVHTRSADRRWQAVGWCATAAIGAGLLATGTRGAWLAGLVAAAMVVPALRRASASERSTERRRVSDRARWVGVGFAAVLCLLVAIPQLSRSTAIGRVDLWATAPSVIADAPIFGAGLDSQRLVLPGGIDDGFEREYGSASLHDRVHSLPLDVLVTSGVVGLAAFGALLWRLGRDMWAIGGERGSGLVLRAVGAAVVGYLVSLLFAFGDPAIDPLAWLLAGLLWRGTSGARNADSDSGVVAPAARRVGVTAAVVAVGVVAVAASAAEVVGEIRLQDALDAASDGDLELALDRLDDAVAVAPARFDFRQAAARLTTSALEGDEPIPEARRTALVDRASEQLDRAEAIATTKDPDVMMDRAELLTAAGSVDDALDLYERVLSVYPRSSRAHLGIGLAAVRAGDVDRAERSWTIAAELAPDDPRALLNLAALAENRGDVNAARQFLDLALQIDPTNEAAVRAGERLAESLADE